MQNFLKKWLYFPSYILFVIGFVFCVYISPVYADVAPTPQVITNQINAEHVIWNKVPISFVVPVGAERMISFPNSVSLHNTDTALTTDKISILNNAGTLYVKAKKAFNSIRIPIILKSSGKVILLDLSAASNADDTPVQVLLAKDQEVIDDKVNSKNIASVAPASYAGLMRHAIQNLYSPERLIEADININRTPMYTTKSVDLVCGEKVIAMPLISWRSGDLYVTAVLLKNFLKYQVHLSVTHLKGKWLAASFYPTNYVKPKGTVHDRTTLFLISNRPFNEALNSMRGYR